VPKSDFRISQQRVAGLEEGAYFWALVEPTWPSGEVRDERAHLRTATRGQRILYSTTLLSRDVSNGGLWQAFWNFELWFMALAENSFARLGAQAQSSALLAARDLLHQGSMQASEDHRRAYLDAHRKRLGSSFDALESVLYGEDRFFPLFHRYIAAHPEEFFLPGT
jgi:hypothetical protein